MSEGAIVRAILAYLATRKDVYAHRQNTGAYSAEHKGKRRFIRFGTPGAADITGVFAKGRRLDIEVKTKTGRVSPAQLRFGELINQAGGLWFVARSVQDVRDRLEVEDRKPWGKSSD